MIYRYSSDDFITRRDKIKLCECCHCGHIGLMSQFTKAYRNASVKPEFSNISPYQSAMKFYLNNFG